MARYQQTDILLNKRDMVWALNYEFKSTEKNWQ